MADNIVKRSYPAFVHIVVQSPEEITEEHMAAAVFSTEMTINTKLNVTPDFSLPKEAKIRVLICIIA